MILNEDIYMQIACLTAEKSLCKRRKVGAILIKGNNILICACNGDVSTCQKCVRNQNDIEAGTLHEICCGIHAEKRLIQFAIDHSIQTNAAIVYCTHSPCRECAIALAKANISSCIYLNEYPDPSFKKIFDENGILYKHIEV